MITLTDIYYYLDIIFSGFGGFTDILNTSLGDLTGSVIVQSSPLGNLTLIGLLLGSGLITYVIITLVKWVKGIIL